MKKVLGIGNALVDVLLEIEANQQNEKFGLPHYYRNHHAMLKLTDNF